MRDGWEARTAWLGLVLGLLAGLVIGVVRDEVVARLEAAGPVEVRGRTESRDPLVRVVSEGCGARRWGSGVVLDDGTVLTNRHVVDAAASVTVWIDDRALTASEVTVGAGLDVARVSVAPARTGAATVERSAVRVGQSVVLVSAYGRIAANVIGTRRGVAPGDPATAWVLDVTAAPGMSGGAVLDERGRWVGVVYAAELGTTRALVIAADDAAASVEGASARPAQPPC